LLRISHFVLSKIFFCRGKYFSFAFEFNEKKKQLWLITVELGTSGRPYYQSAMEVQNYLFPVTHLATIMENLF